MESCVECKVQQRVCLACQRTLVGSIRYAYDELLLRTVKLDFVVTETIDEYLSHWFNDIRYNELYAIWCSRDYPRSGRPVFYINKMDTLPLLSNLSAITYNSRGNKYYKEDMRLTSNLVGRLVHFNTVGVEVGRYAGLRDAESKTFISRRLIKESIELADGAWKFIDVVMDGGHDPFKKKRCV